MGVCSLSSFAVGFIYILKERKGKFYTFAFLGIVALFIGRLYYLILELAGGDNSVFNLGSLGIMSGYTFFFCANLIAAEDSENKSFKKTDIIALIAPLAFAALWLAMYFGDLGFEKMIIVSIYAVISIPFSFFCLKNIIEKNCKNYRWFFITTLVLNLQSMLAEATWLLMDKDYLSIVSNTISGIAAVCFLLLSITLEKGYKNGKRSI